jgi:hypothetical protein
VRASLNRTLDAGASNGDEHTDVIKSTINDNGMKYVTWSDSDGLKINLAENASAEEVAAAYREAEKVY